MTFRIRKERRVLLKFVEGLIGLLSIGQRNCVERKELNVDLWTGSLMVRMTARILERATEREIILINRVYPLKPGTMHGYQVHRKIVGSL